MRFLLPLYRLGLRAYPRQFRARYAEEMSRVCEEKLCDVKRSGRIATLQYCVGTTVDLVAGAVRERLVGLNSAQTAGALAAVLAGTIAAYFDFHATEVQATLLVLITTSFILGYLVPKRAWRRALIIAALLPAIHIAVFALYGGDGNERHPYFSRFLMLAPASIACFIGTYTGAFLRFLSGGLCRRLRSKDGSGTSGS